MDIFRMKNQLFIKPQQEIQFFQEAGIKIWRNWRKLRKEVIKKSKCCAICGYTKKLEGHHILPKHLFPQYALIEQNIIVLCDDCHLHLGHWNNYKDYNPAIRRMATEATIIRLAHQEEIK
jgi:hypothetical protein